MNIIIQNKRKVEFELADLELQIKDFVEDNSVIVSIMIRIYGYSSI